MTDDSTTRGDTSSAAEVVEQPQSRNLVELVVQRPVAVFMVACLVAVFGIVSYQRLSLTLMPDIAYPTITVRTEYPGAAPEEVETVVSRPMEQSLGVVNHLVNISSVSRAELSDVVLEFAWGTDMSEAAQDIREQLERVRLPDEVDRPLILRYDPSLDPIMRVALWGDADMFTLRRLAEDEVQRALETLDGVAAVRVRGGLEQEILVEVSEEKLALLGMNIGQIVTRLRQENVNLSGGQLREGLTEYMVRTLNEFQDLDEMRDLVISDRGNVAIRLSDIATVTSTHKEREVITRIGGTQSVEIEIFKEGDANIVEVAGRVRARLLGTPGQQEYAAGLAEARNDTSEAARDKLRAPKKALLDFVKYRIPEGIGFDILSDQSVFIEASVSEVRDTAILGGILAVIVLHLFLGNLPHTLIIAAAIPMSIIATFAGMYLGDVSLNIMSLGGLALGVGMLVDNSIVVLESIFRCREEGDDILTAAVRGTKEVGGAVIASTLTTIAVFLPIVFVEGVAGQVFGDLSLAVVFSLLASLAVALWFIPMLASRRFGGGGSTGEVLDRVRGAHIIRLAVVGRVRRLVEQFQTDTRPASRARTAALLVAMAPVGLLDYVWRFLAMFAAMVVVFVRSLVAAALPVAWLAYFALGIPKINLFGLNAAKAKQFVERTTEWITREQWWHFTWLTDRIWPPVLSFASPGDLPRRLGAAWAWIRGGTRRRWITIGIAIVVIDQIAVLAGWTSNALESMLASEPSVMGVIGVSALRAIITGVVSLPGVALLVLFLPLLLFGVQLSLEAIGKILLIGLLQVIYALGFLAFSALGILILAFTIGGPSETFPLLAYLVAAAGISAAVYAAVVAVIAPLFEALYSRVERVYPSIIAGALRNRFGVVAGAAVLLAVGVFVMLPTIGSELIPQVHQGEFYVDVQMPVGTPIESTDRVLRRVEAMARSIGGVRQVSATVGAEKTAAASSELGENTGRVTVLLNATNDLQEEELRVMNALRVRLGDLSQVEARMALPVLFSFKTPVEVEIKGYNLDRLRELSEQASERLRALPGFRDVESNIQPGNPEVRITYDRLRLAELGLTPFQVATLIRTKVKGDVATKFRDENMMAGEERRVDVRVQVTEEDKAFVSNLNRMVINPGRQVPVQLSSVADISIVEGPSEIRRIGQQRAAVVSANLEGVDLGTATSLIGGELRQMDWPVDMSYMIGGQNAEMQTSLKSLYFALALAVFLVYVVMASQFESFLHPFVIMFTIPLALIGVVATLWAFELPISVVVFLGIIVLAGIVVNNAIVLVDYVNQLRRNGVEKMEALVQAGQVRLRPILMTTLTTVLGLTPMALGLGEGAEIRTPMAITVIAGLISSTLLTLVVVPTVYSLLDRSK